VRVLMITAALAALSMAANPANSALAMVDDATTQQLSLQASIVPEGLVQVAAQAVTVVDTSPGAQKAQIQRQPQAVAAQLQPPQQNQGQQASPQSVGQQAQQQTVGQQPGATYYGGSPYPAMSQQFSGPPNTAMGQQISGAPASAVGQQYGGPAAPTLGQQYGGMYNANSPFLSDNTPGTYNAPSMNYSAIYGDTSWASGMPWSGYPYIGYGSYYPGYSYSYYTYPNYYGYASYPSSAGVYPPSFNYSTPYYGFRNSNNNNGYFNYLTYATGYPSYAFTYPYYAYTYPIYGYTYPSYAYLYGGMGVGGPAVNSFGQGSYGYLGGNRTR